MILFVGRVVAWANIGIGVIIALTTFIFLWRFWNGVPVLFEGRRDLDALSIGFFLFGAIYAIWKGRRWLVRAKHPHAHYLRTIVKTGQKKSKTRDVRA